VVVLSPEGTGAFELRNVVKRFDSGRHALDGVSLKVKEGSVLVLLGTSGSGKTTTLKMFNRLLEPDSGDVIVLSKNARSWDPIALRRQTGYVIQDVGLLPHMTVGENVALVPRLLGWEKERQAERVDTLLELVGLSPSRFAGLLPRQLSGGERQRVGLARALAADPPLLLMDEPFGALDPLTRRRIQREFQDLQARLQKTVILVTHDVTEAFRLGDTIAVMDSGRIVQTGTPNEIRTHPEADFVREFVTAYEL
jgi:osmoprotectant transport system ATP-binding protein